MSRYKLGHIGIIPARTYKGIARGVRRGERRAHGGVAEDGGEQLAADSLAEPIRQHEQVGEVGHTGPRHDGAEARPLGLRHSATSTRPVLIRCARYGVRMSTPPSGISSPLAAQIAMIDCCVCLGRRPDRDPDVCNTTHHGIIALDAAPEQHDRTSAAISYRRAPNGMSVLGQRRDTQTAT